MEIMQGKRSLMLDAATLTKRLRGYEQLMLDIGTGDGRFVHHMATTNPAMFVIGVDACRENLAKFSRRTPCNALYLIAEAASLPVFLCWRASHITINFPWGSLLHGLLAEDGDLATKLAAVARPTARLAVRLNAEALNGVGWSIEAGSAQVRRLLSHAGFDVTAAHRLHADDLRCLPTTWAKRLAYGRDPRAVLLHGRRREHIHCRQ